MNNFKRTNRKEYNRRRTRLADHSIHRIQRMSMPMLEDDEIRQGNSFSIEFQFTYKWYLVICKGTISLRHPNHHYFRKTNKKKFYGNVFRSHRYQTEAERVKQNANHFKNSHLNHEGYDNNLPYKSVNWYRNVQPGK